MGTDEYQTISGPSEGTYKDRGSKFIAFAFPVSNEEEVKSLIQQVKKSHYECNHHCYAFRLGPSGNIFRSSDDREPSGSAGKPILGQLLSNELTDILIIVVRYFGGNLLGVPGLINSYKTAAGNAIENAAIVVRTINQSIQLSIAYSYLNELMTVLKSEPVQILDQTFDDPVHLSIVIRQSRKNVLMEKMHKHPVLATHLKIN